MDGVGSPSRGPSLTFLDAFEAARDAHMRASSKEGLAYFFSKLDDEQQDRARKAGEDYTSLWQQEIPPNIDDTLYGTTSRFKEARTRWNAYRDMAESIVEGKDNGWAEYMRSHDDRIREMNAKNPSLKLKTTIEMFEEVRSSAQRAEQRAGLETTWGGLIGETAGAVVAAVDPRTDPFNAATLPVGGGGRLAVGRIASQAATQGAVEAYNQITGVQRNRELLGLEHGVGNALWQIGGAAAGGAVLQGGGEAIRLGARRAITGRWFEATPTDPAPPAPPPEPSVRTGPTTSPEFEAAWERAMRPQDRSPLHSHAMGGPRADADMAHVTGELRRWDGPAPWEIAPRTDTVMPTRPGEVEIRLDADRGTESLDQIARRLDPDAFHAYDKLAARREELRQQLKTPEEVAAVADTAAASHEVISQIASMRQQLDSATGKAAKKLQARIAELEATYNETLRMKVPAQSAAPETPGSVQSKLQQELLRLERQIVGMSPTIQRAYARAENKWTVYQERREAIDKMMREGGSIIGPAQTFAPSKVPPEPTRPTPRDFVPEAATVKGGMKPGETLAQAVLRAGEDMRKPVEEAVASMQTSAAKLADVEKIVSEREKLDGSIKTQTEKLADKELKGNDRAVEEHKLKALQEEREQLDTFTTTVDGKEYKLRYDEDIVVPDDDGNLRTIKARDLLKEIDDDSKALKAVQTCSLRETS